MKLTFLGAARCVTGSCHYLEAAGLRMLLDCGMFQGSKLQEERNYPPFPFNPREIDFVLLSHAHIDHCGRIPLLHKSGFQGRVIATQATADLCGILLPDSGHIQEEDAIWEVKHRRKKGFDTTDVKPLYTAEDARASLIHFDGVNYGETITLSDSVHVTFHDAGHILGSSALEINVEENGKRTRLVFSGDLGHTHTVLIRDPERIESADYLVMESTYGTSLHETGDTRRQLFLDIVRRAALKRGNVVIPSFAVGRTQELLYEINDFVESKQMPVVPVYVDSPLAASATAIFRKHRECYNQEAQQRLNKGDDPFEFPGLRIVQTVEESKAINDTPPPKIILSASGMCTAGRIRHHIRNNIDNPRSTILFVGYQAEGTRGRQIRDGAKEITIFGERHKVRAQVAAIDGFSAHADRNGLLGWLRGFRQLPSKVFVVHGDESVARQFADEVGRGFRTQAYAPALGEQVEIA